MIRCEVILVVLVPATCPIGTRHGYVASRVILEGRHGNIINECLLAG